MTTQSCVYVIAEQTATVLDHLSTGGTQQVTVTGRRMSNGTTIVCRGFDCAEFLENLAREGSTPHPNLLVEAYIGYTDVREKASNACAEAGRQPTDENKKTVSNTTSHATPDGRIEAAKLVWARSPARDEAISSLTSFVTTVGYGANGGFGFTVVFSDGGSELYNVKVGDEFGESGFTAVKDSLKKGSGASSCPK
jgi:hypothetical protein